jgi:hypothetical protein
MSATIARDVVTDGRHPSRSRLAGVPSAFPRTFASVAPPVLGVVPGVPLSLTGILACIPSGRGSLTTRILAIFARIFARVLFALATVLAGVLFFVARLVSAIDSLRGLGEGRWGGERQAEQHCDYEG